MREAIEEGIPAGLVFGVPKDFQQQREVPVIAFDCDSTLCSDESDRAYEQGKMPGFREFEFANSAVVMGNGPYGNLLRRYRSSATNILSVNRHFV